MADTTLVIASDSRCTHLDAVNRRCRMIQTTKISDWQTHLAKTE